MTPTDKKRITNRVVVRLQQEIATALHQLKPYFGRCPTEVHTVYHDHGGATLTIKYTLSERNENVEHPVYIDDVYPKAQIRIGNGLAIADPPEAMQYHLVHGAVCLAVSRTQPWFQALVKGIV